MTGLHCSEVILHSIVYLLTVSLLTLFMMMMTNFCKLDRLKLRCNTNEEYVSVCTHNTFKTMSLNRVTKK